MMKIGITGGIGSGKSYVCARLAALGIQVYDCDSAAKRLIRTSAAIRQQLTALTGPDTYHHDGTLNKTVVTQFLLTSEVNAKAIDDIVHPAVAEDFKQSGATWMECAILYESGFDRLVNRVIAVTAPLEVRIDRVMRRDHIGREKTLEWMKRQWPQEQVCQKADFEIVNDGIQDIDLQIKNIINQL